MQPWPIWLVLWYRTFSLDQLRIGMIKIDFCFFIFSGILRFGRKPVVVTSSAITFVFSILHAFATDWYLMLAVRIIVAVFNSSLQTIIYVWGWWRYILGLISVFSKNPKIPYFRPWTMQNESTKVDWSFVLHTMGAGLLGTFALRLLAPRLASYSVACWIANLFWSAFLLVQKILNMINHYIIIHPQEIPGSFLNLRDGLFLVVVSSRRKRFVAKCQFGLKLNCRVDFIWMPKNGILKIRTRFVIW